MAKQEEPSQQQEVTTEPPVSKDDATLENNKLLKQYSPLFNTLDYLFGGNESEELVTSLLSDLGSGKGLFEMGFTMSVKVLWFGIRHPGHTITLLQMNNNKDVFQDKEFQREILENENTWKFVSTIGSSLPLIGVAMRQFGINEFEEGNILDQESLKHLGAALKDPESQKLLKEMAILNTTELPDKNNQIVIKALELMERDNVREYFATKKEVLRNYILQTMQGNIEATLNLKQDSVELQNKIRTALNLPITPQGNDIIQQLLDQQKESQKLQSEIRVALKLNGQVDNNLSPGERIKDIVEKLNSVEDLKLKEKITRLMALEGNINATLTEINKSQDAKLNNQVKQLMELEWQLNNGSLHDTLTYYGLNAEDLNKMTDIVPMMMNQPAILKEIYQNFSTGNYIGIARATLTSAESEPGIQQYFKENQKLFARVIEKVIEQTPSLQGYNLSGNIYEIVPTLLEHPKELANILRLYEGSNTIEAGEEFIKLAMKDERLRGFFVQNKMVAKGVMNQAGLEAYGVGDEVLDVVDTLMKSANMEKFPVIIDFYKQGKWNELVIETCRMIENDQEFNNYLKTNSDNFAKIFSAAIDKMPEIQSYLGDADVGKVLSSVIKDPRSIRELVEGYDQYQKTGSRVALAAAGTRFIVAKTFDYDFRQALYGAASGWLFGSGVDKQSVVNKITAGLNGLEPEERINLNDFARAAIDIAGISDVRKRAELTDSLAKNNLFNGMTISGNETPIILTNLDINRNKFVNSKLDNVRFKNCKLTWVSFTGATFNDVSFEGSEIDGYTLNSLIPALKAGNISLEGVRIVGNLPIGLDLADVDLRGADLSGVTSMKGINLTGADLRGATLPDKEGVLEQAYNLDKARLDKGVLTDTMLKAQEQVIASDIAANFNDLTTTEKTALENKIQELYRNNTGFKAVITATPSNFMQNMTLPLKTDGYSHVSDYRNKTANMLDLIYHYRFNPNNLEIALAAHSIADQITTELFGEGNNRGQDGLLIRQMVAESLFSAIRDNPDVTLQMIMQSDYFDEMVTAMTEDIRAATKYTTAGLATGGIYLPKEVAENGLVTKLTTHFNDAHRFSKAEMEQIHAIADTVGSNLFNAGAQSDRKQDVDFILDGIKEVVAELKKEKGGDDVAEMLGQQREKIAGKVEKGYLYNAYTGLTQIYQDASSYTTAGLATGGIYLKEEVAKGQDILTKVKEEFAKVLTENQNLKSTKPTTNLATQQETKTKGNSTTRT